MTRLSTAFCVFLIVMAPMVSGCSSDEKKAQALYEDGLAYFENQEYEKAKIQLQNAVQLAPDDLEARDLLSRIHMNLGDAQAAFKQFSRLEQLDPENMEYKLQTASFYLLSQQREKAKRRVETVLEKAPENIQALYLHAGILGSEARDLDAVEAVYHKILEIDKNQTKAHMVLAKIHMAENDPEQAENSLEQALAIDPDNTGIYRALFEFHLSRKNLDAAQNVLDSLIAKKPDAVEPLLIAGNFYAAQGKPDAAEKKFQAAIDIDPENINPHMVLAKLLNSQGKKEAAEIHIKKALAL
ncbi:MAG: tetratricopeptide repeat protein, partial [Desulfotignum sp.]